MTSDSAMLLLIIISAEKRLIIQGFFQLIETGTRRWRMLLPPINRYFQSFCEMMIIGGTLSYCRSFEDLVYHVQVLILLGPKYGNIFDGNVANQPLTFLRRLNLSCYAFSLNFISPFSVNSTIGPQATSQ